MSAYLPSEGRLRIALLLLVFVAMNQMKEPLLDATVAQELIYGGSRLLVLALAFIVADGLLSRRRQVAEDTYRWFSPVVLVTLFAVAPFSLLDMLLEPHFPVRDEYVDEYHGLWGAAMAYVSEYVTTVSLLLPVQFLLWLLVDGRASQDIRQAAPAAQGVGLPPTPLPDFLVRAGIRSLEHVLALEADEHYVRVHHRGGSAMVLHRLSSAIENLPEAAGLRVHRSWWVADVAVDFAARGARRWKLMLINGQEVNVSDSYLPQVRERGWLSRRKAAILLGDGQS